MAIIFFFKMFKIWYRFQKWKKTMRKNSSFSRQLHLNRGEEIHAIPNRIFVIGSQCVTKHPKISHITKGDIFKIKVPQSDEKIWWKCSHEGFASVWDPLTRWLSKGVIEPCFLESYPTKFFTFGNFWNKVGMAIIFFSK